MEAVTGEAVTGEAVRGAVVRRWEVPEVRVVPLLTIPLPALSVNRARRKVGRRPIIPMSLLAGPLRAKAKAIGREKAGSLNQFPLAYLKNNACLFLFPQTIRG